MRGQGQLKVDSMHQSEQLERGHTRTRGSLAVRLGLGCRWNHSIAALRKTKVKEKETTFFQAQLCFIASRSKAESRVSLCYSCVPLSPPPFAQATPLTGYFRSGPFETCASVMLRSPRRSAFPFPSFPLLFEPSLLSVPSSAVATLPSAACPHLALLVNKLSTKS